ncbi:MAG: MATE family efflux transporter, partial [Bacteroidia bacterium]|nr:MATE family efflux transporter [Bacteroidia bacterium]
GVSMAYTTIIGLLVGKNRINSTHLLVRDSLYITIILSILCSLIIYYSIFHFDFFRQSIEVTQLSLPYLTLLMWSLTPMLLFFLAKNVCDGFSFTRGGMIITLTALVLNVFLNWVLIYGNLGFDAYGLNGAGYATIISRIFMAITMIALLFYSKQVPIHFKILKLVLSTKKHFRFFKQIWKLGFPTGLQYFFEIAAFAFAAIMAGWFGSKPLAAHQLAITLASLTYMFAGGIAAGSNICVAKAMGNRNNTNALNYGKAGHTLGFISMGIFAIAFFVFDYELAGMFSDDSEVIKMGASLLVLGAIFQLGDGLQAVSLGLLRGIEDVNKPSIVTFIAYWIFAIPVGYYLSHHSATTSFFYGVNGIWVGLAIGLTLSAIVLTYRFYALIRTK